MGKVVVKKNGNDWEVEYLVGKGKNQYVAYREHLDGSDPVLAGELIGKRVEEIRSQVNPRKYIPGI